MLTEEKRETLDLLASVLHDEVPSRFLQKEWPIVYEELVKQTVYALPGTHIDSLGLSDDEKNEYRRCVYQNIAKFYSVMKDQKKALDILEKANIPTVIIKGAAAAVNYLHPMYRCFGDIDILVQKSDFYRTYEVLVSAGYSTRQDPISCQRHIELFTNSGNEIELHYQFLDSDCDEYNIILDEMLFAAIPNRVNYTICGYTFPILPPKENGLVLGHINFHMVYGLGLRQIIDWMYYVEKYLDDDFWENGFSDAAERIGLKKLAIVTTAMCQKYLGLKKDIHWCSYEPVCDELMEYIFSKGNFGRSEDKTDSAEREIFRKFRNPIRGLATAQSFGGASWKACQKHRWLLPFAWVYQLARWLKHAIQKQVSLKSLQEAKSKESAEMNLFRRLEITRMPK